MRTKYAESVKNISYIYDAVGTKLKKVVTDASSLITTEYAENYVYEGGVLQFFSTAEGYVEPKGLGWEYVFQYKDHLGNIRLSYADSNGDGVIAPFGGTQGGEIREENNYYPFGLKHKGYNNTQTGKDHKFEYSGKEWQDELGLNVTAMDFRMYDNSIGRFINIDALTDIMPGITPYRFAYNNPILWKDPKGLMEDPPIQPIHLQEVTVTAKRKPIVHSTESSQDIPAIWTTSFQGTLSDWNRMMGTNFTDSRQAEKWRVETFITKPRLEKQKKEMIAAMHSATSKAAKIIMVAAGTAVAAPYVFSSPVLSAAFWRGATDAGTQFIFNKGEVDLFDASLSAIIPAGGSKLLQGLKFGGQTTIDFTNTEQDFNNIFDGSKSFSDFAVDSFTGAYGQVFFCTTPE